MMAEIIWNNGQGEFDFDFLLNLTSHDFVDDVVKTLDSGSFLSVKITHNADVVTVLVVFPFGIKNLMFYQIDKTSDALYIFKDDLKFALDMIEQKYNDDLIDLSIKDLRLSRPAWSDKRLIDGFKTLTADVYFAELRDLCSNNVDVFASRLSKVKGGIDNA